jgi:hypothetical protein
VQVESIKEQVAPWAQAHGLSSDGDESGADIQYDVLRRDPWGTADERGRFLWLRALLSLNPSVILALVSGRSKERYHSVATGQMEGHPAALCHITSFAAPPYWLEWIPMGWVVGLVLGRVNLTFWQFTLRSEEAARYAGTLSVRENAAGSRGREVVQGRRLETTDRVFGHREVTSESAAFLERFSLVVADGADEIAIRDMFGPSYLMFLTETAPDGTFVELRGDVLSVGIRELALSTEQLDALHTVGQRTLAAVLDGAGATALR